MSLAPTTAPSAASAAAAPVPSPPPPPPPPGPPPPTPPPPPPYPPRPPPLSRQQELEALLRRANLVFYDWVMAYGTIPPPELLDLERIYELVIESS